MRLVLPCDVNDGRISEATLFPALNVLLKLRIRQRESSITRRLPLKVWSKNEPSEYLAHLLERAVNLRRSNPGQRLDGFLDLFGRDPAQTNLPRDHAWVKNGLVAGCNRS